VFTFCVPTAYHISDRSAGTRCLRQRDVEFPGRIPALLARMVRHQQNYIFLSRRAALFLTRIREYANSDRRVSRQNSFFCSPLLIHTAILYSLPTFLVKEVFFLPEGVLTGEKKKGKNKRSRQALDHDYTIWGKFLPARFSSGLVRVIIGGMSFGDDDICQSMDY
jgi:hypothetical protein